MSWMRRMAYLWRRGDGDGDEMEENVFIAIDCLDDDDDDKNCAV